MKLTGPLFGAIVLICALTSSALAQDILGSGSTLCYPVMAKWIEAYEKISSARIVYQPIGSGAGINEIRHAVVDFAVSEAPLDDARLLREGLAQFPLVIGAVVPVVNLAGIAAGQLRFTGPLLADIFMGRVTKWNDPAIVALNSGLALPDLAITVIHRSDGSGTTFTWTNYLSKVSIEWQAKVGENTTVAWPAGFGGNGNNGVAEKVLRVPDGIGYVDYAHAAGRKLTFALVQNHAGNFVPPGTPGFEAATIGVDWMRERDFDISLTDAPAADAYPIMATSFVLVRKYPSDHGHAAAMLAFLRWALENGQDLATAQQYLPLPSSLVRLVEGYWEAGRR